MSSADAGAASRQGAGTVQPEAGVGRLQARPGGGVVQMATSGLPGCKQAKADGKPCRAGARPGSRYCIFHDPELADMRAEARRAGGRRRCPRAVVLSDAEDLPLQNAADVTALLGKAINEVRQGKLDPKVANAIGFLAGVLLRALETSDIAEQLASFRKQIEGVHYGDGGAENRDESTAGAGVM